MTSRTHIHSGYMSSAKLTRYKQDIQGQRATKNLGCYIPKEQAWCDEPE